MSLIEDSAERGNTPEFTVSELSRGVKRTLEDAFGAVRVRGELGRVTFHRNGHVYLDLKDENAVLAGVVWKSSVRGLEIRPQEGDEVIASGRITTFAGQSKYQLVIDQLSYAGEGALLAKLERLKKTLAAEGLFEAARKRPLPFLPRVIGVVTSPTGAVIRDILHRLADRLPAHVLVWPVAVQGPGSAASVAE
ncbi:MAG: exodeoxyribonuclease VII large subunit, partial [Pseudomonadota bacterium]